MKYTVVPAFFFRKESTYEILSEAVQLSETDKVEYKELPQYKAVLVYAYTDGEEASVPVIAKLLESTQRIREHNKLAVYYGEGYVNIAIATGDKLFLANSYPAEDPVTAEYFVFASLKQFQINPQVTTIYIRKPVVGEMTDDLVKYFKGVETI